MYNFKPLLLVSRKLSRVECPVPFIWILPSEISVARTSDLLSYLLPFSLEFCISFNAILTLKNCALQHFAFLNSLPAVLIFSIDL